MCGRAGLVKRGFRLAALSVLECFWPLFVYPRTALLNRKMIDGYLALPIIWKRSSFYYR